MIFIPYDGVGSSTLHSTLTRDVHLGKNKNKTRKDENTKEERFDILRALPTEIVFDILARFDMKSLATIAGVSRFWKR